MSERAVLIVDDDPDILGVVADILELDGYPIATATNGREALEAAARSSPRLVILDMRMPMLDGWGFAREIAPKRNELKILVMTAAPDAQLWADQIHADGCLAKPFHIQQLLSEVHRLCPPSVESEANPT